MAFSGRERRSATKGVEGPCSPLVLSGQSEGAEHQVVEKGSAVSTSGVGGSVVRPETLRLSWWSRMRERSTPRRRWSHWAIVSLPTPGKPLIQTRGPEGLGGPSRYGRTGDVAVDEVMGVVVAGELWEEADEDPAGVVVARRRQGGL